MKMSACDTGPRKGNTQKLSAPPFVEMCPLHVHVCAHVTALYLTDVTECGRRIGNVSKHVRPNERSQGG